MFVALALHIDRSFIDVRNARHQIVLSLHLSKLSGTTLQSSGETDPRSKREEERKTMTNFHGDLPCQDDAYPK